MEEIKEKVRIDASGRLVLPVALRRAAGIKEGHLMALASGSEIILRPERTDAVEIEKWYKEMVSASLRATAMSRAKSKWIGEGYARRKLGL